jgi:hypothetical protein
MPSNNSLYVLTLICTQWTQNLFLLFCTWISKICRIRFKICGNYWNKVSPEEAICQKLLQVNSLEEDRVQTPILHAIFAYNFFVNKFFGFFLIVSNST